MEIPRIHNIMQSLHAWESGQVSVQDIEDVGLAHALISARRKRVGRTAGEAVAHFKEYSDRRNAERAIENIASIAAISMSSSISVE